MTTGVGADRPAPGHQTMVDLLDFLSRLTGSGIGPNDDYFALGLVDSLRSLEIVTYVENAFAVTVEVEDLELDNFRSATAILRFVQAKRSDPLEGTGWGR